MTTAQSFDASGLKAVFVDADDTLWENNMFFLQSLAWLLGVGRLHGLADRATDALMNRWEHHNIRQHGFGYDSYERSLLATLRELAALRPDLAHLHPGLRQRGLQWTRFLRRHPIVFLPGVLEVLPRLATRYRTIIVTKGDPGDQMAKVLRSGLLEFLHGAEVVPTKKPCDYERVLEKHGLRADEVVMIGNSPKSDINNARRAGLRTIYVPHRQTWFLEMEPISAEEPRTAEVPHFGAIADLFGR